jgi:hypothetical protein
MTFKRRGFPLQIRPSLKSLESEGIDIEIGRMALLKFLTSSATRAEGDVSENSERP